MAQSTKSALDEANAPQGTSEQDAHTSRPKSPLSGGSDNDGAEKPVREKLKKASIAGLSAHSKSTGDKVRPESAGAESSAGEEDKNQEDSMLTDTTPSSRGRPTRKRSFDDLRNESTTSADASAQEDSTQSAVHHKRMRSRDMSSTKTTAVNGRVEKEDVEALAEEEDDVEARKSPGGAGIMVGAPLIDGLDATSGSQSPKKKRSRDQFDKDHSVDGSALDEGGKDTALPEKEQRPMHEEVARTNSISDKGEPDKKRHRDTSQEGRTLPGSEPAAPAVEKRSGFANTSAVSPFGSLATSKSSPEAKQPPEPEPSAHEKQQTSSSAFASSGISAFASSSKSPFGNLGGYSGSASGSAFGSFGPKPSSGFGSSFGFRGASPFAAKMGSGIGSLGGTGFGSTLGSGFGGSKTGPSRFLPPDGSTGIVGSGSSSKPLGKSEDGEGHGDEDYDVGSSRTEDDADAKDSRFYEQPVETGEEAEETMFSCRAKLFHFDKEWKERGVGTVKLNIHYAVKEDPEEAPEQRARLIMRTDGVHRVVLNTPIFKGMRYGTPDGKEPNSKTLNLTGMEDGKPALFLLKIGKEDTVKELYHRIACIHDGL